MIVRNSRTRSQTALAGLGASLAVVLLIGLLASPARAEFSAPVGVSGIAASGPKTAVDANGNAIAVWSQYDGQKWRIQEREISAVGAIGPVKTLSAASEKPLWPQIAGNPDGGAFVAWSQPNSIDSTTRIKVQRISASGQLGAVKTISAKGRPARNPRIASDARGDATVIWEQSPQRHTWCIKARKISSKGILGRAKTLSNPRRKSGSPAIASDARGRALAVWGELERKSSSIRARRVSPKGRLGSVMTISASRNAGAALVAGDAHGNALVIWSSNDNGSKWRLKARSISSNGAVGQTKVLHAGRAGQAQIASDANGDMTVVWEADPDIQARQISPMGDLGPTQTLSSPALNGYSPQVAIDSAGNATALWFEIDDSSLPENWYLRARQISATGDLGPVQTLATEAIRDSAIAVNAGGDAYAVWTQLDGSNWRVWGSLGP